jgi:hypothetical protein
LLRIEVNRPESFGTGALGEWKERQKSQGNSDNHRLSPPQDTMVSRLKPQQRNQNSNIKGQFQVVCHGL